MVHNHRWNAGRFRSFKITSIVNILFYSNNFKDYNYWAVGCLELTIEITCCKYPAVSQLAGIWQENKKSLINYMKLANTGVKGVIKFNNGQPAKYVTIQIDSIEPAFKSNEVGEYYRLLLPGSYKLSVLLDCTKVYETTFQISSPSLQTTLNITLSDSIYTQYTSVQNQLDRYAKFCTSSRQPVPCSNYATTVSSAQSNTLQSTSTTTKVVSQIVLTSGTIINNAIAVSHNKFIVLANLFFIVLYLIN